MGERSVQNHLERVYAAFSKGLEGVWTDRIDALQLLTLISKEYTGEVDLLIQFLIENKNMVLLQITDLRSQVIRQASETFSDVSIAALQHGSSQMISKYSSIFAPGLLQNCIQLMMRTKKVMSQAGDSCAKSLILEMASNGSKVVLGICSKSLKHKNHLVRRASAEYLKMILEAWPQSFLRRRENEIFSDIKKSLSDADPVVRKISREAFSLAQTKFSEGSRENEQLSQKVGSKTASSKASSNDGVSHKSRKLDRQPVKNERLSIRDKLEQRALSSDKAFRERLNNVKEPVANDVILVKPKPDTTPRQKMKPLLSQTEAAKMKLKIIISDAESKVWSVRLNALSALQNIVQENVYELDDDQVVCKLSRNKLEKIFNLLIEKLSDSHYRVLQVALRTFGMIAPFLKENLAFVIERVLPAVYIHAHENSTKVKEEADQVVRVLENIHEPDVFMSIVCGMLRNQSESVRLGCIESMIRLAPQTSHFLSVQTNVSNLLERVGSNLTSKRNELKSLSEEALKTLFHWNQTRFAVALSEEIEENLNHSIIHALAGQLYISAEELISNFEELLQHHYEEGKPKDDEKEVEHDNRDDNQSLYSCSRDSINIDLSNKFSEVVAVCETQEMENLSAAVNAIKLDHLGQLSTQKKNEDTKSLEKSDRISRLLSQLELATSPQIEETLELLDQIGFWILDDKFITNDMWEQFIPPIVTALLGALRYDERIIQERCLEILGTIIRKKCKYVATLIEVLFSRLLNCFVNGDESSVSYLANKTLELLVKKGNTSTLLVVLIRLISNEKTLILGESLKLLTILFERLPSTQLLSTLPEISPPLQNAFGDQDVSIRRAAMLSYVKLYLVLGEAATPFLDELTPSQNKLVSIYIDKEHGATTR